MEQKELEITLALLKYKESHVRGIAKITNQPHANVSRLMKKLLKENIVDFKYEGKNKIFRLKKGIEALNCIYMSEHFKLLKLFEKYPSITIIAESIIRKVDEKLIIIFGSFAKFSSTKDSDIDIFIETTNRHIKLAVENINSKLSVKIGQFDTNSLLVKEIIKDHILLKGVEYYYEKNKIFD